MTDIATAVAVVVVLWWASTGAILYLDGLPQRTHKWSLFAIAAIGIAALLALVVIRRHETPTGALLAFGAGLAVWAIPTAAFYFGVVTGPRHGPMPPGLTGWPRFRAAVETMIYHEALCIAGALILTVMLWSQPNKVALWTYLLLWAMHVSGKLNMYFGVPNLSEEFLPPHLTYLASYMRTRPMNLLFPVSVSLATLVTAALAGWAWSAPVGSHTAVGATLLAVLALLAVVEHWLLVLPLQPMALWTWSLRSRASSSDAPPAAETPFRRPA